MTIDFTVIDDYLFSLPKIEPQNELEKAKELQAQLTNSIEWLTWMISKEEGYQEKQNLQKEKTAATWELDRLTKEINKVKNNEK